MWKSQSKQPSCAGHMVWTSVLLQCIYPTTISTELYSICCLIITSQGRRSFLFVTQPDCFGCIYETDYELKKNFPHSIWHHSHNCHKLSSVQILKEVYESYKGKGNYQTTSFTSIDLITHENQSNCKCYKVIWI